MKPHLILTLRPEILAPPAPYWVDAVANKNGTQIPPTATIARTLADVGMRTITTAEYAPAASSGWSADERAAQLDRTYRLIIADERPIPPAMVEALRQLPEVQDVRVGLIAASPLPPIRATSASLRGSNYAMPQRLIRLAEAHRITRGSAQVTVAILDTGVDTSHPEFAGRVVKPMDFVDILDGADEFVGDYLGPDAQPDDDVGHGTHVAAIAVGGGQAMALGAAPLCRIMPVRVLGAINTGDGGRVGAGLIDNINAGVKYAVDNGAHVINMSLGVERAGSGLPHEQVIRYANARGVTIVAAAGNDGRENLYYPGALPGVVAVGATGAHGDVSEFSTYGPHVTLTAPGEDINSAQPGGAYGAATGTSHAAPFVAGTAALICALARTAGGRASPRDIRRALRASSDRFGSAYRDRRGGFGRLNCLDALRAAQLEFA